MLWKEMKYVVNAVQEVGLDPGPRRLYLSKEWGLSRRVVRMQEACRGRHGMRG